MTNDMRVLKLLRMSHCLFLAGGIAALCDQIKFHWFLAIWHKTSCILDHTKQLKKICHETAFLYHFTRIV